jgi:hypothetical protein
MVLPNVLMLFKTALKSADAIVPLLKVVGFASFSVSSRLATRRSQKKVRLLLIPVSFIAIFAILSQDLSVIAA